MMDIQTKEKFLKEYDKITKNVTQNNKVNFQVKLLKWFDYLQYSNIALVKFIIDELMKYSNCFKFSKLAHEDLKSSDPFMEEKLEALRLLDKIRHKHNFITDFLLLKSTYYNFQEKLVISNGIVDIYYLPKFENVSKNLREIFKKSLGITDGDPTVDGDEQRGIPASDRIVKINHNAPEYQEIIEKLEELEASIRKSNSIENEDKDRLQAELKAGEGILKGKTARIEVIKTLLVKGLKYIIEHVANAAIAVTAEYLLKLICQYFGLTV